ncbi:MAG: GPI inositol-deacylase [Trebouxia sp. A1-2]|nr:MAG: GPI inositol-deacylase [Trebouxia sp. A1-2]
MTYMWPSYHSLTELDNLGQQYELYLYKEGRQSLSNSRDALAFASGPPVLFLHGSDGSYKQVRSLASETARPSEASGKPALAWFAADFKEEMSAFDGAILERQTIFVVDCVKWLRQHYRQTYAADMPVVLVGHSMGGLVARAAAIALASEAGSSQYFLSLPHHL